MIDECNFCGRKIESDGTDDHRYKMLMIHIWMYHDETHLGIPLKDTAEFGPTSGDEEE